MSISTVPATPPAFQPNAQQGAFRQDFQSLTSALQSGDLSSAQQAYQTLLSDNPQLASATQSGNGNPFQQAIASIGAALQNGDLSGAQNALQTMQANMKAHHGHHHHAQSTSDAANAASVDGTQSNSADPQIATSSLLNLLA
jgi:hypothetical protein